MSSDNTSPEWFSSTRPSIKRPTTARRSSSYWSSATLSPASRSIKVSFRYSARITNAQPRVSMISRRVASSTRRMAATLPSGDACWKLQRIRRASLPSWRMPMFWPATPPFVKALGSYRSWSLRFFPTVTMISPVANRSRKRSLRPFTRCSLPLRYLQTACVSQILIIMFYILKWRLILNWKTFYTYMKYLITFWEFSKIRYCFENHLYTMNLLKNRSLLTFS